MNISDEIEDWVSMNSPIDCYLCQKQIPTKDSSTISIDCEYFGVIGYMLVRVCKECGRESSLNKLGI